MYSSKEPSYAKNQITKEDIPKIINVFQNLESEVDAYDFLAPVDYVYLNILDYPEVIKNPMDLGTAKKNLQDGKYHTFKEFLSDIDLIWENCRVYNLPGSEITKKANHCDKLFKKQMDKYFKCTNNTKSNAKENASSGANINNETSLTMTQKMNLTEKIRMLNNDGLSKVVSIIIKKCPKGIEDIDNEKLQIKIDLIDTKTFEELMNVVDSCVTKGNPKDTKESAQEEKEPAKEETVSG